ncbi:galactose mutarotase [Bacillus sp. FJAT-49711]|uniref:aldose epimerase family protein n=1 Tax=Bacillus sp. FJAT-49711 TaxID=2833585 RepID=UPI001BCA327D|nr:aldose epimerase family protein [Bacillus sp. FJAT-49711]MBS4219202.1 galactose mutarotase [Bacillus sp. FJAT-49711]
MKIRKEEFGKLKANSVTAFTLENDHGVKVTSLDYGCIITKILTPNRDGELENIVLGYNQLEGYLNNTAYFGSVVGRVAGRIGGAEFTLNGKKYSLAKNENDNHLHGGLKGFDKVIWGAETEEKADEVSVKFSYISPDGEEGYPGNLKMNITYTLNNDNEFTIHYEGISDKTTLLNVTNHSYFNLSGDLKKDILDHELTLKSDQYLELQDNLLPTGEFANVEGTPFDFRKGRFIRSGAESEYQQNEIAGGGYDHPFVLNENRNEEIVLKDPESGRQMIVETDEVGVVVYTSNQLAGDDEIYGVQPRKHLAICLETQGLPDAVHHDHFPSWVLEKDKPHSSVTTFKFGVME